MVSEPPLGHPLLTIRGRNFTGFNVHNSVQVRNKTKPYEVSCSVSGGIPDTTVTSIVCAGVDVTTGGLLVTEDMDGHYCTCTGSHASGCYDKKTNVILEIVGKLSLTFKSPPSFRKTRK